jgi:hypothetical protein
MGTITAIEATKAAANIADRLPLKSNGARKLRILFSLGKVFEEPTLETKRSFLAKRSA